MGLWPADVANQIQMREAMAVIGERPTLGAVPLARNTGVHFGMYNTKKSW